MLNDIEIKTIEALSKYVDLNNFMFVGSFAAKTLGKPDVIVKDLDAYTSGTVISMLWNNKETRNALYVSRPEFEISEDGVFIGVCARMRPVGLLPVNLSSPYLLNGNKVPLLDRAKSTAGVVEYFTPTKDSFVQLLRTKARPKDIERVVYFESLADITK